MFKKHAIISKRCRCCNPMFQVSKLIYECFMIMLMLCKSSYARLTPEVLQRQPCSVAFQRSRCPRIVRPPMRFARYSSRWRRSRQRAHCLSDASSTPANARSLSGLIGMHQSTRHHREVGSRPRSRYISISAATVTQTTPSMPADVPTVTREKGPTTAIILDVADATIAVRTKA